jgi:flagellar hook assembly protein FlgD
MKRLVVGIIAAAVLFSVASTAMAQTKSAMTEIRVEMGTIEAIDAATRAVTIKKTDGTVVTTIAGPEVKRFDELKVGDKIKARYYENLVVRVKQPGESDADFTKKAATPSASTLPGGTKAKQRTLTVTITAIDMNAPSISFTTVDGLKYISKVQDPSALAKVKVGDKIDIIWTEALLVSLER